MPVSHPPTSDRFDYTIRIPRRLAVRLRVEARRLGGPEKPWRAALSTLLTHCRRLPVGR